MGVANFSASTTHALRATALLAAHSDGEAVLGRDLARKLKIPPDYLSRRSPLWPVVACSLPSVARRGATDWPGRQSGSSWWKS